MNQLGGDVKEETWDDFWNGLGDYETFYFHICMSIPITFPIFAER